MKKSTTLRSDIAWSTPDKVVVKGFDLPKTLLGHINFGDMAFLEIMDRLPSPAESVMFNALLVSLVEHGITPSALATRLTIMGAPESLQGAVAAGLLGLGNVFVGTIEGSAKMLQEALADQPLTHDLDQTATQLVEQHIQNHRNIPGIGHPIHKPVDPRSERLFDLAQSTGYEGPYVGLMKRVAERASERLGKTLPVNVTGAIGAIASEMGIGWTVCRGLGVMARAVGLVGHILEEGRQPLAPQLWLNTEKEATLHLTDGDAGSTDSPQDR